MLELSVVLSSGEYLVANVYQNADLFWALRGGGGGTYGIVISVTYRTYPEVPVQVYSYSANVTNSSAMPDLVEGFLRYQDQLTSDGWGGYGSLSSNGLSFTYFAPGMDNETVAPSIQDWENFTQSLAPYGVESDSSTDYSPSWYELAYLLMFPGGADTGGYVVISSRLITRQSIVTNASAVTDVFILCGGGFKWVFDRVCLLWIG